MRHFFLEFRPLTKRHCGAFCGPLFQDSKKNSPRLGSIATFPLSQRGEFRPPLEISFHALQSIGRDTLPFFRARLKCITPPPFPWFIWEEVSSQPTLPLRESMDPLLVRWSLETTRFLFPFPFSSTCCRRYHFTPPP